MFANCFNISIKKSGYLVAVEPYSLILQPNFKLYG